MKLFIYINFESQEIKKPVYLVVKFKQIFMTPCLFADLIA